MRKADFNTKLEWSEKIWGKKKCWRWFPLEVDEHRQRISVGGRRHLVHRYLYELLRARGKPLAGPLKKNQPLVRTCDGAACISPHHHMPALSRKAIAESGEWTGIEPNDPRGAHNRRKDKCPYGHVYSAQNTGWTKDGKRRCLACHRERAWLPLDLRHIVYPNERVRKHTPPPKPIHPEADEALWNAGDGDLCDVDPKHEASGLM